MSTANEKEINSYSYGEKKNPHPLYLFLIHTLLLQSTEEVLMAFSYTFSLQRLASADEAKILMTGIRTLVSNVFLAGIFKVLW